MYVVLCSPDLDERIRRDPQLLDEYLKEEEGPQNPSKSHFHSSFSSVVITTRPDGVSNKLLNLL